MLKDKRGSVTVMAYVAMLFISLYGAILLGNASRKYKVQTDQINSIMSSYNYNVEGNEIITLYKNLGGEELNISSNP